MFYIEGIIMGRMLMMAADEEVESTTAACRMRFLLRREVTC